MPLLHFNRYAPYKRKKGAMRFFQLIYHNFFDLVTLNLLFILTLATVVFAGAGYFALCNVFYFYIKDEPVSPIKEFFRGLKTYLIKGSVMGIFLLLLIFIIGFSFAFYFSFTKKNIIFFIPAVTALLCLVLVVCGVPYFVTAVITKKTEPLKSAAKAVLLCAMFFKNSVFYLLILFFFTAAFLSLFPYSIPLTALFSASPVILCGCVCSYNPVIKNISP